MIGRGQAPALRTDPDSRHPGEESGAGPESVGVSLLDPEDHGGGRLEDDLHVRILDSLRNEFAVLAVGDRPACAELVANRPRWAVDLTAPDAAPEPVQVW